MRLRTRLFFIGLALVATISHADSTSEAAKLKELLGNISSFTAGFSQVSADTDMVVSGQLWLKKPGQFRILTQSLGEQWLISDGRSLWNYDADLEQVVITNAGTDPAEVPVLLFASEAGDIESAYTISGYRDEQLQHFHLEPVTNSSLFRSISVAFDDNVPVYLSIQALSGQTTTLEIHQPEMNGDLSPELFTFKVPEGIDVLDDR